MSDDLLARLERYYDAVPRAAARVEEHGPLTLFVGTGAWPYYARPRAGWNGGPATARDVAAVRARQRELGVPEALEWIADREPTLAGAATGAGMTVDHCPLLMLTDVRTAPAPAGVRVRIAPADDPALAAATAAVMVGFGTPGTAVGAAGPAERDADAADTAYVAFVRERIAAGHTLAVIAEDDGGPLASGLANVVGDTAELVGIATLPAARRRGIGGAVTAALADAARERGVELVFLSAADDAVARVYEGAGFARVFTACIAAA